MEKISLMTHKLLLPHRFKLIGWILLIPATILGIITTSTDFEFSFLETTVLSFFSDEALGSPEFFTLMPINLTHTIVGSVFIIGALMVSFSKEKKEDEFIMELRLSSLLWSVWVNYILLLIAFVAVYGMAFFTVMIYNMFTILIIFIIRFNYILYKSSKLVADEK